MGCLLDPAQLFSGASRSRYNSRGLNQRSNTNFKLETGVRLQRSDRTTVQEVGKKILYEESVLNLVPSECWLYTWMNRQAAEGRGLVNEID
jgi:hypothetical protein